MLFLAVVPDHDRRDVVSRRGLPQIAATFKDRPGQEDGVMAA
jgi:hypothetical protein